MTITAITRYEASCSACGRPFYEAKYERLDFPSVDAANDYAEICGWTVQGDDLICTSRDERHLSLKETP